MMVINENTSRADLEIAAIFECSLDLSKIEAASDDDLRDMIREWIEAGDECAAS